MQGLRNVILLSNRERWPTDVSTVSGMQRHGQQRRPGQDSSRWQKQKPTTLAIPARTQKIQFAFGWIFWLGQKAAGEERYC